MELFGDVLCGALVGFGAGIAAFHGVVGEGGGLGPPGGGGGVWLLRGLRWSDERKKGNECGIERAGQVHGRRLSPGV